MNRAGFQEVLKTRGLTDDQINQHCEAVEQFEAYCAGLNPPQKLESVSAETAQEYVQTLVAHQANSYETLLALARYGRFCRNQALSIAILELLDGSEAFEGMYRRVGEVLGSQQRDRIFEGAAIPPLGVSNIEKARLTRRVMERLLLEVTDKDCQEIFASSFRDLPDEYYLNDKKLYQEIGNFDQFLERKRQDFIALLEKHLHEGSLFFSQPITQAVVDFVRSDPEISQGVRVDNILYVTKIPYLTAEYLVENDPLRKRYAYCHCPWARESLREGQNPVSARFCQCSAGFHKKSWEVIFGQPLQADVLESVLQGDMRCRFAIHLPI